jgi:hypothetical protein
MFPLITILSDVAMGDVETNPLQEDVNSLREVRMD